MTRRQGQEERSIDEAIFSRLGKDGRLIIENSDYSSLDKIYFRNSRYIELISKWMEVFSSENFLIIKSEDLFNNSQVELNKIFNFFKIKSHELSKYPKINSFFIPKLRAIKNNYCKTTFDPIMKS